MYKQKMISDFPPSPPCYSVVFPKPQSDNYFLAAKATYLGVILDPSLYLLL